MTAASKPSIPARDSDGAEHLLGVVDHPAGAITVYDAEIVRILAPAAAVELVLALLHALGKRVPAA